MLDTCTTIAPSFPYTSILLCVFVTLWTVCSHFEVITCLASFHIKCVQNRFQVMRVETSMDATKMIKLESNWNWLDYMLIGNAMCQLVSDWSSHMPVPFGIAGAIPNHAWVFTPMLQRIVNEIVQALYKLRVDGNLVSHRFALLWRSCGPHAVSSSAGLFLLYLLRGCYL